MTPQRSRRLLVEQGFLSVKARIVITGVAGFIRSNLAGGLLREGYQVIGIDNLACGGCELEQR